MTVQACNRYSLWPVFRLIKKKFADSLTPTRRSIAYPHHQVTFTVPKVFWNYIQKSL